jgi:hypothetical protein
LRSLKRIATKNDNIVDIEEPVSDEEILYRHLNYPLLAPNQFAKQYRTLFKPIKFLWQSHSYDLQLNTCTNPFCKWFGMPQDRFETVKNKPYRYKLTGNPKDKNQRVTCNPDPLEPDKGYMTWNCTSGTISNWSAAEEIKRLIQKSSIQDMDGNYIFHREACAQANLNPFENPKDFYKRGKSSSNSQKWQCKTCKKLTNVLLKQKESFSYHQKRNDVLYPFALALIGRTPIKRTIENLQIGSSTYYSKLEWLYKRCLEFLERHETNNLTHKSFDTMWLNTDKLVYHLNNVRKSGQANHRYDNLEDKQMQTHVVISADVHSLYVFGADVAYDWDIRIEDLEHDTALYKDDHLDEFSRKNARLRFSFAPQSPTAHDTQTVAEFTEEWNEFNRRKKYIDGLHVNSTYTTFVQLWLLKQKINAKEWRFVTDEDASIMSALFRAFSKEVRLGEAHHFLCKVDRSKSRQDAFREYQEGQRDLSLWGMSLGIDDASISKLAYLKLKEKFKTSQFHEKVTIDGKRHRRSAKNPIEHPMPTPDKGWYSVDCTTDLSSYEPKQIANMVLQVNDRTTNAFLQQIRRRLSILERPLVTARGDGKSYIYTNFNPKYAQYAITILRTYYNYCQPYKSLDKQKLTPAQRLGLAAKPYTIKDIIYMM